MAFDPITAGERDAKSPMDTDLWDKVGLNLDDHETRILSLEGGGGGGGAAGVEVTEKFTELKKKFGDGVVDPNPKAMQASFFSAQRTIEYRLMRDTLASATTAFIMTNPRFLESGNENFEFTGFAWTALASTDTGSVVADAVNNEIGTNAPSFTKPAGTNVLSGITRDVTAALAISIASHRVSAFNFRTPTVNTLTDIFVRLSNDATPTTNYAEWRVTVQQDGAAFVAGDPANIIKVDYTAAKFANPGTGFDLETQLVRSIAIGTVSGSSQVVGQQTISSFFFGPNTNQGVSEVFPDYQQLWTPGDGGVIADSVNHEPFTPDQAATEVFGKTAIVALTNAFTGGSASTIRRSTLKTGNNRAEFNDDPKLTSGTVENDQDFIEKLILPTPITSGAVDISIELQTNLHGFINAKPLATSFTVRTNADFTAQFKNTDVLRFYTVRFVNGTAIFERVDTVELTADSTFLTDTMTFTVSAPDNSLLTLGDFVIKDKEVQTAVHVGALNTNDVLTSFITPDSQPIIDIGLPYPEKNKIFMHAHLGGVTASEAARNRVPSASSPGSLTLAGSLTQDEQFLNGQLAVSGFTASDHYFIDGTTFDSELDPDTTDAGVISTGIWFFPTLVASGLQQRLIARTTGANGYMLTYNSQTVVLFLNGSTTSTSAVVALNQWHHVAATWEDLVGTSLWVDGVEQTQTASNNIAPVVTNLFIGSSGSGNNFHGRLADFLFHSAHRIKSNSVQQIFNLGAHRPLGCTPGGFKNIINLTGQAGQKIVTRHNTLRRTNAQLTELKKGVSISLSA